jgi:DNA adenine methylase
MWRELQNGWQPKEYYSKKEYEKIKEDYRTDGDKYPDYVKGYVGYTCSFRGMFFHSYSGNDGIREYQQLAMHRILTGSSRNKKKKTKQLNINNIQFNNVDYKDLIIPRGSVVYCDAPYLGTTSDGYSSNNIEYDDYYNWLRDLSQYNEVYISEQWMPDDFTVIWEQEHTYQLAKNKQPIYERLYRYITPDDAQQQININQSAIILILLYFNILSILKSNQYISNNIKLNYNKHFKSFRNIILFILNDLCNSLPNQFKINH